MRISDWSSDVCASDLRTERAVPAGAGGEGTRLLLGIGNLLDLVADQHGDRAAGRAPAGLAVAIGDGDRRAGEPQLDRPAAATAAGFAPFCHRPAPRPPARAGRGWRAGSVPLRPGPPTNRKRGR